MDPFGTDTVRAAYDQVASDYAAAFGDDLARLPVDREVLDNVAVPGGNALDLGCGPGTVAAYLRGRGMSVTGLDLSLEMLRLARSQAVDALVQGDMCHLPFGRGAFDLVVAFYSIHHVLRSRVGHVLEEVDRVLGPGGVLLVATHLGEGDVVVDELLGHRLAPVGGALYRRDEIVERLEGARFTVDHERQRDPLPHEHDSRRIYLLARSSPARSHR